MGRKFIKGNLYYYESRRVGPRVVSDYRGSGQFAILCCQLDAIERELRTTRRDEAKRWRAELLAEEAKADEVFTRIEAVFVEAMAAAGYWRPKRGPWRRRRMDTVLAKMAKPPRVPLTRAEAVELGCKAEAGDATALTSFREWMRNEGAYAINDLGSPKVRAEGKLVTAFSNGNPPFKEAAKLKLKLFRAALGGESPPLLEQLLVDRVTYCWFVLWALEARLANDTGQTFRQLEYLDRRVNHAHRRFLSAIKALAVLRKLDVSTVLSETQSVTVTASAGEVESR